MTQRTTVRTVLCIAALLAALCGCGGGSDAGTSTTANPNGSSSGGTGGIPETIQGIATPSSVSVVTATNAQ